MARVKDNSLSFLDTSWIRQQVTNHLLFNPVIVSQRNVKWFLIIFLLFYFVLLLINHDKYTWQHFARYVMYAPGILAILYLKRFQSYYLAALCWLTAKLILGVLSFCLILGGIIYLLSGRGGAEVMIMLGLVWIPGLEFINKISRYQRVVTMIRIVFTLLVVLIS